MVSILQSLGITIHLSLALTVLLFAGLFAGPVAFLFGGENGK